MHRVRCRADSGVAVAAPARVEMRQLPAGRDCDACGDCGLGCTPRIDEFPGIGYRGHSMRSRSRCWFQASSSLPDWSAFLFSHSASAYWRLLTSRRMPRGVRRLIHSNRSSDPAPSPFLFFDGIRPAGCREPRYGLKISSNGTAISGFCVRKTASVTSRISLRV